MSFPKIEGYVVTEKLGSGSYSTVYKAFTKVGARSTVAIKCVDKSRVKHSGAAVDNLITEIRLLKTLTHPHIVHMKQFTWDDRNIYIIMEYCCGGDLSKYIHRYGRVPEKQVLYFLQQLASALKFLRERGVVHMDLKPHNLLLHKGSDGKYILKVADFGFAQHMSEEAVRSLRGSPLYMAPEMLRGRYDARVDLWSVGVIMYECLFGRAPYSSATFKELVDKIQRQAPIELPPKSSISAGCQDLLTRLLQHDPDKRISYEEFFAHEYLDLEHMPSKENYEKAVNLIKQAIELESSGQLGEALRAYSEGLRYLVPAVGCETDALRRSALTAKLTSYMERAEEIKRFLKGETVSSATPRVEVNGGHGQSQSTQCNPCCKPPQSNSGSLEMSQLNDQVSDAALEPDEDNSTNCAIELNPSANDRVKRRGALARFLRRKVPPLNKTDASLTAEVADKTEKNGSEDAGNDMCKIT
ncbi:unnamed protein product [Parnassius mnemosyne]|uniref:Serine/threonine-protein kinase ULK3 n=1 Tax=Parnassius mnemosyne TaxID=213953 RepID=A0AAV1LBT0_9NEOP